jgi:hypothetical protein
MDTPRRLGIFERHVGAGGSQPLNRPANRSLAFFSRELSTGA